MDSRSIEQSQQLKSNSKKNSHSNPNGLSDWIEKNSMDYVAHAIWPCNQESVLNSGFVHPAEFLLRQPPYSVECEGEKFGVRNVLDFSSLMNKLSELKLTVPTTVTLNHFLAVDDLVDFGFLTQEEYSLLEKTLGQENNSVQLKDGKEYLIRYSTERKSYLIDGIPSFDCNNIVFKMNEFMVSSNFVYPVGDTNTTAVSMFTALRLRLMQDVINKNIFDKQLALVWNFYKPLINKNKIPYLAHYLQDLREQEFGRTKLNAGIRCLFKKICWEYGDVVVLKGQASEIIGSTNNLTPGRGKDRSNFYSEPLDDNQEVELLAPWEHKNGESYSLDLSDKDTIIIGLEKKISAYRGKYKVYSYEEMTQNQLDFFLVPEELRPDISITVRNNVSQFSYGIFSKNQLLQKANQYLSDARQNINASQTKDAINLRPRPPC